MFDIKREMILRDVEWALSVGITRCQRSAFGAQLEHARNYGYDSDGKRIPIQRANSWDFMPVKRQFTEPGYELDFGDAFRIGRVQRWLRAVDALDSVACDAIMCMYGDAGSRWGRDAVLLQLTQTGHRIIVRLRASGGIACELSDLELLANDDALQIRQPTKRRGKEHDRMRVEAQELKIRAIRILTKVAVEQS